MEHLVRTKLALLRMEYSIRLILSSFLLPLAERKDDMIKVLIWFGMIAVMTFTLFSVWALLRTGAEADERLEAIFYKEFYENKEEQQPI